MKIECSKEKLRDLVILAERLTGKNLSLPVLGSVFLQAADTSLTIRSTNLDVGFEATIPAKVAQPGQVAVNGAILGNFLTNLTAPPLITLETVNNNITIQTAHNSSVIKSFPSNDYPTIPKLTKTNSFSLSLVELLTGFRAVTYAASLSSIKPEIGSVYLYQDGGGLVFVATDSFRLAEKRLLVEPVIKEPVNLIIPLKNVTEACRVFEGVVGEAVIQYTTNQLSIRAGDRYFTTRLIDGIFPDYRQIIPTTNQTETILIKQDLLNALKLSNVFLDKLYQAHLTVRPKEKIVELGVRNTDIGDNDIKLEAVIKGEEVEIVFNVRYILDCLAVIISEKVVFKFAGPRKPVVIRGVGDTSFLYLVMPITR